VSWEKNENVDDVKEKDFQNKEGNEILESSTKLSETYLKSDVLRISQVISRVMPR